MRLQLLVLALVGGCAAKHGKMALDANGVPCGSFLANKASCGHLLEVPHVRHYAFCEVMRDTAATCPEPLAQAMDAMGNSLEVTKTIRLFVKSDKKKIPEAVPWALGAVPALDYNQRGEYTLQYDAKDAKGNEAQTILFNFFMNDHYGPSFTLKETDGLKILDPLVPASKLWYLPQAKAEDGYDGDVTRTLTAELTKPDGSKVVANNTLDTMHLHIDTSAKGNYKVVWAANDFASVFGKNYTDNIDMVVGHIEMEPRNYLTFKSGSRHFTLHYPVENSTPTMPPTTAPTKAPSTPTPSPTKSTVPTPPTKPPTKSPTTPTSPPTQPPTHYVYIPPIIILQLMGEVVARGSPYGSHHDEETYKKHLSHRGYDDERIAAHLEAIVMREEEMGILLGEEHKWWFSHPKPNKVNWKNTTTTTRTAHTAAMNHSIESAAGRWHRERSAMNLPKEMAGSPNIGFGSHPPPARQSPPHPVLYQHKPADDAPATEQEIADAKARSKKYGAPPMTHNARVFRGDGTFANSLDPEQHHSGSAAERAAAIHAALLKQLTHHRRLLLSMKQPKHHALAGGALVLGSLSLVALFAIKARGTTRGAVQQTV